MSGPLRCLLATSLSLPGLVAVGLLAPAAAQTANQTANQAADPSPVLRLDTLTVTATRTENSSFDLPASVSVIGREALDERQASDLTILRQVPGVNLGGGARPAGQIPSIRGLQGPRVILSVDGARRNYSDNIRTPLLIDPDFIRQIDIVRGPSSALYGSGGIGGVMAFRTIEADDVLEPGRTAGGQAKVGYRSADDRLSGNLTGAVRSGGVDLLAGLTLRESSDIRLGDGSDLVNDGHLRSGLFKAGVALDDLNRVSLSYQRYNDDLTTSSNPGGGPAFGLLQDLERRQDQFTGSYRFRDAERKWLDGSVTAYHTTLHFKTIPYTAGVTATDVQMRTAGIGAQNTTRFDMAPWLGQRVTYGFDAYRDTSRNRDGDNPNTVQPDGAQESLGFFIQDEIAIGQDWKLIGALRHDRYRLEPSGGSTSDDQRLSPKVALHWQAQPFLGLFVGYAEAFRAPTLAETYQNLNTTRALSNFRPNPDLKPETSRGWETGFTLAFDDVIRKGDAARLKATFFDEDVDNLITSATVGRYTRAAPFSGTGLIFQNQNVSKAERWGMEVEGTYALGPFDLGIGYSRIRSKDATTGANLFAPPDKVTLAARYRFDEHWSAWWTAQFVDDQDYDSTVLRRRDGYGLHDIGVAYDRAWYRVDLGVTNLFDQAYVTYQQSQATTYTYEEGRSVNVTLTARF